ncbi:MAG: type II secretion system F family protein [Patescibacteria group bacterium]
MKKDKNIQILNRISLLDKLLFTKHLAMMVKSGITLSEAVEAIASQTQSNKFREVLTKISQDIKNGNSFSKALKRHPKVFNQFYIILTEVGEESGTLSESLEYLAKSIAKEYALNKKIQGALLYPAIILIAVSLVGAGMSIFVLPQLSNLFESLNVELPITTKILLFFASTMKNYGVFVIAGFVALLLMLRIFIKLPKIRPRWDSLMLSFPIFGPLLTNKELTSLCRNLGIMLKSGLPITKALEVEYIGTSNLVFKDYIERIEKSVNKGKEIREELDQGNYSRFSPIAIKMIGVGEKTGKLDEAFLYLGDFFEDEVDNIAKNLSVVLEPFILLIIGVIVGFVALAIISPIYELTGSIK